MLKKLQCLSGNTLKLLAMVFMTLDHVGLMLFPSVLWLRIVGRLAMPIFAFMIAEGCTYTKNRRKYLLTVVFFAAVCQLVYLVVMRSVYQCILVTFAMSISLIFLLDHAEKNRSVFGWLLFAAAYGAVAAVCFLGPRLIPGFRIDYDLWGVSLPLLIYTGKSRSARLVMAACGMILLSHFLGWIQWYCLLALPLLMLYNGERGKWRMKYFFYLYFPLHLAILSGISILIA